MTLSACPSVAAAALITSSELPWHQLVGLGPSGFDSYARLRFLPDPVYDGQPEIQLDQDTPSEHDMLRPTLEVLREHTTTPDDVYYCLWDGWGLDNWPPSMLTGQRVEIPNRSYLLLHGTLSDFGDWDAVEASPGHPRFHLPDPAFIWPADQAWCIANDVDPHYAGIGATSTAVEHLLAVRGLDIVSADPRIELPHYG
jgi:hypothetical protein